MGNSRPIPEYLVENIGLPIPRPKILEFLCSGNDFLKRAAGIIIVPTESANNCDNNNQLRITQPEQGAN